MGDKSVRTAALLCAVVVLVAISVMVIIRSSGAVPGSGRPGAGPVYRTPEEQALEKFEKEAREASQNGDRSKVPGTNQGVPSGR